MGLFGNMTTTLVVDVAGVLKAKGVRGRAAPRQQLQILRSLSRLVQREKMNVTAVIAGKPLNKAPHKQLLDGVCVRYAKSDEKLGAELVSALRQAGSGAVLVSNDVELEKRVRKSGKESLRISTFRKMLDDGNEPMDGQGGKGRGNNRNNNNNRRDRGPRPDRDKAKPKVPKKTEQEDAISQMIDLVE